MKNEFWGKVLKGLNWFLHSYIWLFIIFLATDIITKQCVVRNLGPLSESERSITLIRSWDPNKPFLAISYVVNTNAAFSFGVGSALANRIFYSIVAFCGFAIITTIFIWKYKKLKGVVKACLMLIATGAVGNLIDRLFYSASFLHNAENGVVDWIDFQVIWPFTFNIADSCVVIGVIMMIVYLIIDEVKLAKAKRKAEVEETKGKVLSKEELSRMEGEGAADEDLDEEEDMHGVEGE